MSAELSHQYSELVSLTKLYIAQEYEATDRVFEEMGTFEYFRQYAVEQNKIVKPEPPNSIPVVVLQPKAPPPPSIVSKPVTSLSQPIQSIKPIEVKQVVRQPPPQAKTAAVVSALPEPKRAAQQEPDSKQPFRLAAPVEAKPIDIQDIKKILEEKFPQIKLIDQIPDDAAARALKNPTLKIEEAPVVIILAFNLDNEMAPHQTFLDNLCKALSQHGAPAKIYDAVRIEREKGWEALLKSDQLKLVVANGASIHSLPEMKKQHREVQKSAQHFLGKYPMLLLSDISHYLKEPNLKRPLWNAIWAILGQK